jgi:hypothetical protein
LAFAWFLPRELALNPESSISPHLQNRGDNYPGKEKKSRKMAGEDGYHLEGVLRDSG